MIVFVMKVGSHSTKHGKDDGDTCLTLVFFRKSVSLLSFFSAKNVHNSHSSTRHLKMRILSKQDDEVWPSDGKNKINGKLLLLFFCSP